MDRGTIYRWLAAEMAGREAEAEKALSRLFRALPMPSASAAFADRVMAGAGLLVPHGLPLSRGTVMGWRSRAAIAAALFTCGLAAVFMPPLVIASLQLISPGPTQAVEVLAAVVQGAVAALGRIDELLALWRFAVNLGQAAWLVATSPPVALTLLSMTALASLALRWLTELLNPQRNPGYVQAHA